MARDFDLLQAFSAGEISPYLDGRSDLQFYRSGVRQMLNMVALPEGPAVRRPGTRYIATAPGTGILRRFRFSTTQAYILEFTDLLMRVYKDKAAVLSGSAVFTLAVAWTEAQVAALQFTQSFDQLYVFHGAVRPQVISRLADDNWTVADWAFEDGPWLAENTTATTLACSGVSGSVTVTASAVTGINDDAGFASTDVGRLIRIDDDADGNWTWLEITAFTDTTHVTATVKGDNLASGAATTVWRLGAWSDTTGWPACGTFHGQRLGAGGTALEPNRVDLSALGDFPVFTPGSTDSDAISHTIDAGEVDAVLWMQSDETLYLGTSTRVVELTGSSGGLPTPSSRSTPPVLKRVGMAAVAPVVAQNRLLVLDEMARQMIEVDFVEQRQAYDGDNLITRARHLTENLSISAWCYTNEPIPVVWAVRSDGALVAFTYDPKNGVLAFHSHVLGGAFSTGDAVVVSCDAIPGSDGDELWLLVKRTVNSSTVYYVEVLEPWFDKDTVIADAHFADCGIEYDGAATDTLVGADHLIGETVQVLGDGATHDDVVVDGSGNVILDREVEKAWVGLACPARLKTVRLGSAASLMGRITKLFVRVYRSAGFESGPAPDDLYQHPLRKVSDALDAAPELVTEDVEVDAQDQGWLRDPAIAIGQDLPLPLMVLSIVAELNQETRG